MALEKSKDEYCKQMVSALVAELFVVFESERKENGDEFFFLMAQRTISALIGTTVFRALSGIPLPVGATARASSLSDATDNRPLETARKYFKELKTLIESSVGSGFAGGLSAAYERENKDVILEYLCTITKVQGMIEGTGVDS